MPPAAPRMRCGAPLIFPFPAPCHSETVTDVTVVGIRNTLCTGKEYGLPHQCAHWLAMTRLLPGAGMNPPVTALPCQPPLGKGARENGAFAPQKSLPCLKGGGPAAGWWRDTCGADSNSLAKSLCGGTHGCHPTKNCRAGPACPAAYGDESPSHGSAVPAPFRQGGQ